MVEAFPLCAAARTLSLEVGGLRFSAPVTHVYNPLDYARKPHELYLRKYGQGRKRVLFLGMNPGPFGMAQTGVPFGEVTVVRDWLGISGPVGHPDPENPAKPVTGFACPRSEVSGQRLWGLFARRFDTPAAFFADHFVANYCPLLFLSGTRNLTPDKLDRSETTPLTAACDEHLRTVADILRPAFVIGVGKYARAQAERALSGRPGLGIADILHPSPASPAANRGWAEVATKQLQALGVWA